MRAQLLLLAMLLAGCEDNTSSTYPDWATLKAHLDPSTARMIELRRKSFPDETHANWCGYIYVEPEPTQAEAISRAEALRALPPDDEPLHSVAVMVAGARASREYRRQIRTDCQAVIAELQQSRS